MYRVRLKPKTGTAWNQAKNTPHEPRVWPKKKSYPFLRDYDPDTPVNGYCAFTRFCFFFCLTIAWLIVYHGTLFSTAASGVNFLCFLKYIFALLIFTTSTSFILLYSTIMRTRVRASTYYILIRTNHALNITHVRLTAVLSLCS